MQHRNQSSKSRSSDELLGYSIDVIDVSAAEPVSLSLVRQHCRVVVNDEDELLTMQARAARELVERESGVHLVRKTVREILPKFPCGRSIELHAWPVISVDSITYIDEDEEEQTLDLETYVSTSLGTRPSLVTLRSDEGWPTTDCDRPDAVTIEYSVGFDANSKPAPDAALQAILLLTGHWYRNREAAVIGTINNELAIGLDRLIAQIQDSRYP